VNLLAGFEPVGGPDLCAVHDYTAGCDEFLYLMTGKEVTGLEEKFVDAAPTPGFGYH